MLEEFSHSILNRIDDEVKERNDVLNGGAVNTMEFYRLKFGEKQGLLKAKEIIHEAIRTWVSNTIIGNSEGISNADSGNNEGNTRKYY
jgi:hypothetical protein